MTEGASIIGAGGDQYDQLIDTCLILLSQSPDLGDVRRALGGLYLVKADLSLNTRNHSSISEAKRYLELAVKLSDVAVYSPSLEAALRLYRMEKAEGKRELSESYFRFIIDSVDDLSLADALTILPIIEPEFIALNTSEARRAISALYVKGGQTSMGKATETYGFEEVLAAYNLWDRAFTLDPTIDSEESLEARFSAASCCLLLGRVQDALRFVGQAIRINEERIKKTPLGKAGIRFLQTRSATLTNIGQLTNELEYFQKSGDLGEREKVNPVLLAKEVVNPCIVRYWRKYYSVVTDSSLVRRMSERASEYETNSFWFSLGGDEVEFQWRAMIRLQKKWESESRAPLLMLQKSHQADGWKALGTLGVPEGAPFITLHVRDQSKGKLGKQVQAKPTSHRDADIDTYIEMIKMLASRGIYTIRMGDVSMKPLPELPGSVDYIHSNVRCDWMDIFCIAESSVFVGTMSGLYGVASNFGVPSLLTNVSPFASVPLYAHDIYIPKLLRRVQSGSYVPFREAFKEPLGWCYNTPTYRHYGVEVVNNTSEEITEAVSETIDRLEGKYVETQFDRDLQSRFKQIADSNVPGGISCRIGAKFLSRYQSLLLDS